MSSIEQCEQVIKPFVDEMKWQGSIVPLDGIGNEQYAVQVEIETDKKSLYPLLELYSDHSNQQIWVWWYNGLEHVAWSEQQVKRLYKKIMQGYL